MNLSSPTAVAARILTLGLPVTLSALLVSACGLFGREEKKPEYYAAAESPPLQLPPGLDQPLGASALIIETPKAPLPQKTLATVPPRVASESTSKSSSTRIRWSTEGAYLLVADTPESVQRRLGYAIKRAGMSVRETGAAGSFHFDYRHQPPERDEGFFSKLAFWRDDGPNYSGSYEVTTRAEAENTRIYVRNADGSDSDPEAAEHLLNLFAQRLG